VGRLRPGRLIEPPPNPYQPSLVAVDKDPQVAALLERYLEGYQVLQAQDMEEVEELTQWHYLMAGSLMAMIPCLPIFFFQKTFVQGAVLTGLKG